MNDQELIERGHLAFGERARAGALGDGGEVSEADGLLMYASGASEFPVLVNGAIPLGEPDPAVALGQARAFFAPRGRGYTLIVRDLAEYDRAFESAIEAAGIPLLLPRHPVMVCDAPLPPRELPDRVELRAIDHDGGFDDFKAVLMSAFPAIGFPETEVKAVLTPKYALGENVVAWVAYLDERPVSAAMVIVDHGIGGIVWVGTVESARGKGLGDACTRAATNAGFERGAEAAWLEASVMGEPIYERMGYRHLFAYKLYVVPPEA